MLKKLDAGYLRDMLVLRACAALHVVGCAMYPVAVVAILFDPSAAVCRL
jgi:hypothetical protein